MSICLNCKNRRKDEWGNGGGGGLGWRREWITLKITGMVGWVEIVQDL